MTGRASTLASIAVGDIFHAECPNGASLICLTLEVTEHAIRARTVTTQREYEFDRRHGLRLGGQQRCAIDSVATLPSEIQGVLLELDLRYRLKTAPNYVALKRAEIDALDFVDTFYASNPL